MPIVSVIIPNYNHALFLRQRINSVLDQTFQQFELIILDDCSTDNSREIIETYRNNPRISHIIYSDYNSGSTFRQWEKGITLAKGDLIWIAESDDNCQIDFLENVIKIFIDNPGVGLAYTQSMGINEKDEKLQSWINHTGDIDEDLWQKNFSMTGKDFVKRYMLYKNPIPNASAVVFKKKAHRDVGGCNINFKINGDWDLYSRMLFNTDIFFLYKSLNFYRQHVNKGSSININNGNNIKEYYWLAKQWKKSLSLTKNDQRKLFEHIYKIWWHQVGSNLKNLLRHRFWKIFEAAFDADKRIIFRIFFAR